MVTKFSYADNDFQQSSEKSRVSETVSATRHLTSRGTPADEHPPTPLITLKAPTSLHGMQKSVTNCHALCSQSGVCVSLLYSLSSRDGDLPPELNGARQMSPAILTAVVHHATLFSWCSSTRSDVLDRSRLGAATRLRCAPMWAKWDVVGRKRD